ncbi:hypothetical protein ACEYYB_07315 [Paracoccus sp. p4-l81]
MLRTISIGSCVSVQGLFEGLTASGTMLVRVGDRLFEGHPVSA